MLRCQGSGRIRPGWRGPGGAARPRLGAGPPFGCNGSQMPADRADLGARLAAATAADTSRGLNYASVLALVREHFGEDAARRCDPLGKASRIDFFKYPIGEYLA